MIINQSLVARTFGSYTIQLFDVSNSSVLVPVLAVGLIIVAFLINMAGNKIIGGVSEITAVLKVGGILIFALVALWAADFTFQPAIGGLGNQASPAGFLAAVALAILAYKGFTTITNSGGEVANPERNVGRAIIISLAICVVVYLLVCFAVGSALSIDKIVKAKDFSLAEAARPSLGQAGVWFTVAIAMIATASGLFASVFAVSRMLAMLTQMKLIPHSHFHMPGSVQQHTLVYTVVIAAVLAAAFDLSRIASLGAIFYLLMDITIHWGVLRHLHKDVGANRAVLGVAIALDVLVLGAFLAVKAASDPLIVVISLVSIAALVALERFYLQRLRAS
jgi:amino acid transporter